MNDINVEIEDINSAIDIKGKISGYSNNVNVEDLITDIRKNISDYEFKNAKTIILIFHTNPNINISVINKLMDILNEITSNETDIIFGTNIKDSLDTNIIGYRILLTGI